MEVVIVIQPDDWLDESDVGHRIFGVFSSRLAAEAAVRKAINDSSTPDDEMEEEFTRFAFEVFEVDQRQADEIE